MHLSYRGELVRRKTIFADCEDTPLDPVLTPILYTLILQRGLSLVDAKKIFADCNCNQHPSWLSAYKLHMYN